MKSIAAVQMRTPRKRLSLERLEDRMLMNGDPVPLTIAIGTFDIDSIIQVPNFSLMKDRPTIMSEKGVDEQSSAGSSFSIPAWLMEEIDNRYGSQFGTSYSLQGFMSYPWNWSCDTTLFRMADLDAQNTAFTNSFGENASGTNVQMLGVDEADLLETDGEYVYLITGNELVIVDARDPENLSIASRIQLGQSPSGMYLDGERLTLVSSGSRTSSEASVNLPLWSGNALIAIDMAWYGSSINQHSTTEVMVLDLADRTAPTMVQNTQLDGRLVDSRMVDGELRIVVQQDSLYLPDYLPSIQQTSEFDEATNTWTYTYESRDSYLQRADEALSHVSTPGYQTLSVSGEVLQREAFVALEDFQLSDHAMRGTATTIATFDSQSDVAGPTATKTLVTTNPAEIYATTESIYLFGQSASYDFQAGTKIWKFDFGNQDATIALAATGSVAGNVQNQFSADEHEGYLRVVTSTGWGGDQQLSVLKQTGHKLKMVGSVDSLAPGERLHSVRFKGDRAFVVTFRKVDPLFSIDLSDPENPEVAGELKIPGFSDYLQPLDATHLLGIGRGANESMGLFQELQLSIFDVTDLSDPQLSHRYSFGGGRSTASIVTGDRWSQGDGDHHAFSYFADQQIVAVPIYSADQGGSFFAGIDNTPLFAQAQGGLHVFSIDVSSGFQETALIEHDSPIIRSLRIGDNLFAISTGTISVHNLIDPTQEIDKLDLGIGSDVGLVELTAYQPIAPADLQGMAAFAVSLDQASTSEFGMGNREETAASQTDPLHTEFRSDLLNVGLKSKSSIPREQAFAALGAGDLAFSAELEVDLIAEEFAALVG